jgi:hypothetical protein
MFNVLHLSLPLILLFMMRLRSTSAALALVLMLSACANTGGNVTDTNDVENYDERETVQDLADYLQAEGHVVAVGPEIVQPGLSAPTTQMTVDGQRIYVEQFSDEMAAVQEAGRISPDGLMIDNREIEWLGEPHFYQEGNLLVFYVGNDAEMLRTLEDAMGIQIAGGNPTGTGSAVED